MAIKINSIQNKTNSLIVFFIMFCILASNCCWFNISGIGHILQGLSILFSVCIMVYYFIKQKISKYIVYVLLYSGVALIATVLNNADFFIEYIKEFYKIIVVSVFFDLFLRKKENVNRILSVSLYVYFLLEIINLLSIILYPKGIDIGNIYKDNWFLGYKNVQIFYHLPCLVLAYINLQFDKKKYRFLFYANIIIITIVVFYTKSSNSMVAYFLLLTYLLINKIKKKKNIVNIKNSIIASLILWFYIVIVRVQDGIAWLVNRILHKSLTFTGRTFIWDKVIAAINKSYILGYGIQSEEQIARKLGNQAFTHAHNTILDITYKTGIIGLVSFGFLIYKVAHQLYLYKKNNIVQFISFVFFIIFVMMIFESRQTKVGLYVIMIISYYIKNIIELMQVEEREVNVES